ncbi:hypothetical protein B7494_g6248 [Chlorociboria aeruginascens]|nr:hypothetical protein B7494_g6248 [Chlorociboria aeruginascens]
MSADSIAAITESLPPASDPLTYLTILESHLTPEILPTLNSILQDTELTQNIGWDLVHLLLPFPDSAECLCTIARLGNPREVVLKVTEELRLLRLDPDREDDVEEAVGPNAGESPSEPTDIDKFCILAKLLSILHPRIKTKFPSRFLSTSLIALLAAFRPSNQATLAVISFIHTISGRKRPPLPGRESSRYLLTTPSVPNPADPTAPDPEAQDEDPEEAAIQTRLLQSFLTHILEDFINANPLFWSTRLLESFEPTKLLKRDGKKTEGERFREEPTLQLRDTIVGQLMALVRDLGLSDDSILLDAIFKLDSEPSDDNVEEYPSSPDNIPLSRSGSLYLIASSVFSSVIFGTKSLQPKMTIFPDHAKLTAYFLDGDEESSTEPSEAIIDAILAIGLWLEHNNSFVSGPLDDQDFHEHLRSLSLLSAMNPKPPMRYAAHVLTSAILHAHPIDRVRLTFISETLSAEDRLFQPLRVSAITWLKEEIVTADERLSQNAFASPTALTSVQSYLFPDMSHLDRLSNEQLIEKLLQDFPFHMSVINFLFFVGSKQYEHVVAPGTIAEVEAIYLDPLQQAQEKSIQFLDTQDMSNPPTSVRLLFLLSPAPELAHNAEHRSKSNGRQPPFSDRRLLSKFIFGINCARLTMVWRRLQLATLEIQQHVSGDTRVPVNQGNTASQITTRQQSSGQYQHQNLNQNRQKLTIPDQGKPSPPTEIINRPVSFLPPEPTSTTILGDYEARCLCD